MKKKYLKRILPIMLFGVLLLSGCGKKVEKVESQEKGINKEENIEQTTNEEESAAEKETKPTGFQGYIKDDRGISWKDGYFIIKSRSFEGVVDSNGENILDPIYDVVIFPESESAKEIVVGAEGKYGLYNYKGEELLPIEYDGISTSNLRTKYLVEKDGKQSIVDAKGKVEKELKGTYNGMRSDALLYGGEDNTNNSIMTGELGRIIAETSCSSLYNLDEQCVCKGGLKEIGEEVICVYEQNDGVFSGVRFIHNTGKELFAFENYFEERREKGLENSMIVFPAINESYMEITFGSGRAEYKSGEYLYDIAAKKMIECRYNQVSVRDDKVYGEVDGRIDIYGNGSKKSSFEIGENEEVQFIGDFIVVKYGTTYRIYNEDGEEIIPERFASSEWFQQDVIVVETLEGEYKWLDKNGEIKMPAGIEDPDHYNGKEIDDIFECNGYLYIITYEDLENGSELYNVDVL